MPVEKKKVNLVNLKAKFGVFLYNNYCCQNCYSIDKFAFGFMCDHKLCLNCNDNQLDRCKVCNEEVEIMTNDTFQNKMFPHLEDLKNIMSIDLHKVSNKLRQQNGQINNGQQTSSKTTQDQNGKSNDKKVDDNKMDIDEHDKNNERQEIENKIDEKETDKSNDNDDKPANRTSRRQAAKKANDSNNTPTKEPEPVKNTSKSNRSNKIKDKAPTSLKGMFEEFANENAKEIEKTATKSARKTDKSTKGSATKNKHSIVIISTSITENELKLLNKFAKKFNAKIVTEFTDEITHLVTLEAKPKLTTRTLKYLKSLLTHKWLLNFDWVKACMDNDKLVDEADYELLGITKQNEDSLGAPKRSRENSDLSLFEGKKFYIDGKFGPKCGLPKNDYKELVKVGGGDVVESEKEIDDNTYIIIEATYLNKSKYKGRDNTLTTTDFLNYVSDFKFDL